LTRSEAGELLGPSVDEATGAALFEESGGNPFYLEQLARAVQRSSSLAIAARHDSLTDLHVPPRVAAALADELSLLSESERRQLVEWNQTASSTTAALAVHALPGGL